MSQNLTTFNAVLTSSGARMVSLLQPGHTWFVGTNGSDTLGGISKQTPFQSIEKALSVAHAGDTIALLPGSYDEAVVIPRSSGLAGLSIVGLGNRGSVAIAPSASNSNGLVTDVDDLTLSNVGLAAVGSGRALINTGSRLRAYDCKLENDDATGVCARMMIQTVAQRAAGTKGNGADCHLERCEFAWAASGVEIVNSDQGAVTELQVVDCWFHDLDTNHIFETVGSGGSAGVMYNSLLLKNNTHSMNEAGTAPAKFVLLNGNNANTGILAGGSFPVAHSGGKVLLSTKLLAVGVLFADGLSTGQPT